MENKHVFFIAICLVLSFLIVSCTNKQTLEPIPDGDIQIRDFTGVKLPDENGFEFQFVQTISWDYPHKDALFAIRIQTTNGEIPEDINTNADGWILWDENSIWTEEKQFSHQFQSQFGNLEHIISTVELKSLYDNQESEIKEVSFYDYREIGTVISAKGGTIHEKTVGQAVEIYMLENIEDIFVDGLYADHFMYRLNTIDENTEEILNEGEWHNSIHQENIRKVFLNEYSEPPLFANNPGELTQFEAYVVTKSGYADSSNTSAIHFTVSDQFSPETILYLQNSFMLGEHHYASILPYYYNDFNILSNIPTEIIDGETRYGMPFWQDMNEEYCLIGEENTDFYFHTGWRGEYTYNNPWYPYENQVLDRETGINYLAWIEYIDYRLDNAPLELPYEHSFEIVSDIDGTEWLRIPATMDQAQKLNINGLQIGQHLLEIRVVDSQLKPDEEPVSFEFTMHEYIPLENREGIFVVNSTSGTQHINDVEEAYQEILNHLGVSYQMVDYNSLPYPEYSPAENKVSPTDLQQYKLVIFNQDVEPNYHNNFHREFYAFYQYVQTGGNLVVSGGSNLRHSHVYAYNSGYYPFHQFFSTGTGDDDISYFGGNYLENPYFVSAEPDNGFATELHLELNPPNFSATLLNLVQGLGPIAKLNSFTSQVIYRYGSKLPGEDTWEPTEDWYDEFNGFPVALKQEHENGSKCYLFGFPLLYMEIDGVKSLYQEIWNELD